MASPWCRREARRSVIEAMRARTAGAVAAGADAVALVATEYQRLVVLRGGLTEGPAFFALVIYMVSANMLALGVAGAAVILLGANFPSADEMRQLATESAR